MKAEQIEELRNKVANAETDIEKAAALNNLAWELFQLSQLDEALIHGEEAFLCSKSIGSTFNEAKALITLGSISQLMGDYTIALDQFNRAYILFEEIDAKLQLGYVIGNIGTVYMSMSDYTRSLEYFQKGLSIAEELGNQMSIAINFLNIGASYEALCEYPLAFEYNFKALAIFEEKGVKANIAGAYNNIGNIYTSTSDYVRALECFHKALAIEEESENKINISTNLVNIGLVYNLLSDYNRALEYYQNAMDISESIGYKMITSLCLDHIGCIHAKQMEYHIALENFKRALSVNEAIGNKTGIASNLGNIGSVLDSCSNFKDAFEYYQKALIICEEIGDKKNTATIIGGIGELYAKQNYEGFDPIKAEEYLLKAISIFEEISSTDNACQCHKSIANLYKTEKRWEECQAHFEKYHELRDEIQNEEVKKQADKLAYERKTSEREKQFAVERARAQATDEILINILPLNIVERLIKGEKKIADTHENVSVLFADIVGFTKISSLLPASELIDLLDIVFTRFDTICKKHGLEKIKTIGDAYMAVCGAPVAYENHAERTAHAAIEMLEDFEIDQKFSIPIDLGFRIGLHSGSVIAGIIGDNKYSYDLWGDAVNTASRMESYGEEDKIHVSEDFRNSAGDGFTFSERGEMDIKGKGMMKTYFLKKVK